MGPIVAVIVAFSLLIGLTVWLIRYGRKKNRKKNELYKNLGLKLGLQYTESKHFFVMIPHLGGRWRNHNVEVYEKIVGSGKNQTVYTNIRFSNSPHNFQFRIGKEHFFSKIGKKMGFKDIEFDNFELDKKFLFKSKDESEFRILMDYKLLHDLQGIEHCIKGNIQNDRNVLSYSMVGAITKAEKMEELEKVLGFMGKLMEKSR